MNKYQGISKAKIALTASLSQRKFRKKEQLFVVEGKKSVSDTIAHFQLEYLAALPDWIENNVEFCAENADKIYMADAGEMRKMSSLSTPTDVIAVYHLPESKSQEEILSSLLPEDLYLMLDSIQDPGNLGTIIRTAQWYGVKRIFASNMTADVFNPKTIQSSMGAISSVSVEYVDLSMLADRNKHLPVIGLQLEGENIYSTDLPTAGFIVMGNEGNGLSPSMLRELNLGLTIPPYNPSDHPESLNVAVATAITLSQFRAKALQ